MDSALNQGGPHADHVREVVRSAEEELKALLRQRAEVMRRIGTIKQTLTGLAKIFGKSVLNDELLAMVEGRTGAERQRGFTRACRMVLMDSESPLSARQVCEQMNKRFPEVLERQSSPLASVTTVLGRLENYSEVSCSTSSTGRRLWLWIADRTVKVSSGLEPEQEGTIPANLWEQ
jgi:hypothetical protein